MCVQPSERCTSNSSTITRTSADRAMRRHERLTARHCMPSRGESHRLLVWPAVARLAKGPERARVAGLPAVALVIDRDSPLTADSLRLNPERRLVPEVGIEPTLPEGNGILSRLQGGRLPGSLIHDMRRSAVRSFERAGVPRSVAMSIVGHRTASIYRPIVGTPSWMGSCNGSGSTPRCLDGSPCDSTIDVHRYSAPSK
jgi:hypothetical protein